MNNVLKVLESAVVPGRNGVLVVAELLEGSDISGFDRLRNERTGDVWTLGGQAMTPFPTTAHATKVAMGLTGKTDSVELLAPGDLLVGIPNE